MTISFDFDETLEQRKYQILAKKFIELGANVIITTSRNQKEDNSDLYEIAQSLGITRITFTNYKHKIYHLNNVDLHFDNDEEEIMPIKSNNIVGALIF